MQLRSLLTLSFAMAVASAPALADNAPAGQPPQQFAQLGDLTLENHDMIRDCAIGYRTLGKLNADKSNAVLFTTWHTGKSEQALPLINPKGLFDPSSYYVIVVDAIGNGVSCSPSNSKSQHGTTFPAFSIRDMVESQHQLLTDKLGIQHLHAVIGFSMGGMQTFQWMVSYPDFMDVAVPIAGTPHPTSQDMLLFRTLEKAMLADPAYVNGHYQGNPTLPLFELIFALNFNTPEYRVAATSPSEFKKFFDETVAPSPSAPDANDNLWQIRAILNQDIGEGAPRADGNGRSLEQAAQKVRAHVHVVNSARDMLVNASAPLAFAKLIHADTTVLQSNCGHDFTDCDMPVVRQVVEKALSTVR